MSKEEIDSCNECDLMSFLNNDNFAYLYDDAELICRVIQYFTINIFDVSLGEVNLIITKKSPTKDGESAETFMKVFIWGVIILLVAATIFLFWAWIEFENTEYIIAATLAVASGIWCVGKLDDHYL